MVANQVAPAGALDWDYLIEAGAMGGWAIGRVGLADVDHDVLAKYQGYVFVSIIP